MNAQHVNPITRTFLTVAAVLLMLAPGLLPSSTAQTPAIPTPSLTQVPLTVPSTPADAPVEFATEAQAQEWRASMSAPMRVTSPDSVVIRMTLSAPGNGTGAYPLEVVARNDSGSWVLATPTAPSLEAGGAWQYNVTIIPSEGLTDVELRLATATGTRNGDNTAVLARTWIHRGYSTPVVVGRPFIFEGGLAGVPMPIEIPSDSSNGLQGLPLPTLAPGRRLLVHKAWADSRLEWPSVVDSTYGIEVRDDVAYYSLAGAADEEASLLERFQPTVDHAVFGRGSGDSVLFAERPMRVRILEVPHWNNDSVFNVTPPWSPTLALDFDDGDAKGQDLWLNATWLASFGLFAPEFTYADGTSLVAKRNGDHWLVHATHFSTIHVTGGTGLTAFDHVNDAPYSSFYPWLTADRRDTIDESLLADFLPHAAWTVSVLVDVEGQGDGQAAYPLGLGNRTERENPAPDDHDVVRRALAFFYRSNTLGATRPEIEAFYAGDDGVKHTVWTWSSTDPDEFQYEFRNVKLQLRQVGNQVYFELFDSGGNLARSVPVEVGSLPMAYIDSVFLSTEEGALNTAAAVAALRVRQLDVALERGNVINEDFGSAGGPQWQMSAHAAVVPTEGFLRLVSSLPDEAGTALYTTNLVQPRLSVEFRYRVGPTNGPEGLALLFYKNLDYVPASGRAMAFEDANLETSVGHEGYGVAIPTQTAACRPDWGGPYVALFQDTSCNVLGRSGFAVHEYPGDAGVWHTVHAIMSGNRYTAYYDGYPAIKGVTSFDRAHGGFGFSAATGTYGADHDVDYVYASVADILETANHAPYLPTDPSPGSGATVFVPPASLNLSWNGGDIDGTPITYEVLVDETNPPTTVRCTTLARTCSLVGLEAGKQYYWQVRALDGITSILGPVWDFVTGTNAAPYAPSNPAPADGATRQPFSLSLRWNNGDPNGQAVTDRVLFGTTTPPATTKCSNVSTRLCSVSGLAPGTMHYWRVESTSAGGTTMGPVWQFRTDVPPAVPSLPSPSNGAVGQPRSLSLSWIGGDADGTLPTYTVTFGTANPPATAKCSSMQANVCPAGSLAYDALYYWRVTATDGRSTVVGPVWSFRTEVNLAPFTPSVPYPGSGTTNWSVSPFTLAWAGGDPNGGPVTYRVTYTATRSAAGLAQAPASLGGTWCQSAAVPACSIGVLAEETTYTWSVAASDGVLTTQGPAWTLVTGINHPSFRPVVVSPQEEATNHDLTLRLDWIGGDPDRSNPTYTVYLDTKDPPGTKRCIGVVAPSCVVTDLSYNTTYHWRVSPSDAIVRLPGLVWTFTTKPSPVERAPFEPSSPAPSYDTLLDDGTVSVRWVGGDPDGGQVNYTVYLVDAHHNGPVCTNVATPNCSFTGLTSGTHRWSVEANDGTHTVRGPQWWMFRTAARESFAGLVDPGPLPGSGGREALVIPHDVFPTAHHDGDYEAGDPTPPDGAEQVVPVGVHLLWDGENPTGNLYDVYLWKNGDAPGQPVCIDLDAPECMVPFDLQWGKEYCWSVEPSHQDAATYDTQGAFLGTYEGSPSPPTTFCFTTSTCLGRWCPTVEQQKEWLLTTAGQLVYENTPEPEEDEEDDGTEDFPLPIPLAPALTSLGDLTGGERCAAQTETNQACTVLFLHGFGPPSFDFEGFLSVMFNQAYWYGPTQSSMNGWRLAPYFLDRGYSRALNLGYYGGDCGTDASVDNHWSRDVYHGSHDVYFPTDHADDHSASRKTGCDGGNPLVHTLDTDIRHLAYHLAWYIYDNWSDPDHLPDTPGETVDVVAHSLGGIVLRTAIQIVQDAAGTDPNLPPFLLVEDAVTFGSPHSGTIVGCVSAMRDWVQEWGFDLDHGILQGEQLCPFGHFAWWLKNRAALPQATGPEGSDVTEWSLVGSTGRSLFNLCCMSKGGDNLIHWISATGMPEVPHKYVYVNPKYMHWGSSGFYSEENDGTDADLDWWGPDVNGERPAKSHDENSPRFRPLVLKLAGPNA